MLSESADAPGQAAPWIGPLLALGARAARYSQKVAGRQLVIALSVPKRDFAAALIGCGWVLASEAPVLAEPLVALRALEPGQPLRAVNSRQVITGFFSSLNETVHPPRAQFAGSLWRVDSIQAVAPLPELEQPEQAPRPEPGSLEHMALLDSTWDARLAKPAADLAIVGTATWLKEDFEACLGKEGDHIPPSSIEALLMPKMGRVATWFTRIFSSARLADHLPLPTDLRTVILDGGGAIKYVAEIETPVIICILDRSVADETAAEILVQMRNTRGEPVVISDLGWRPPTGVEAFAFTAAL
ncbi:hypothetical protein [Nocardia carnea]|uniref:Uncharacterized protein n=1 Tax=Nocardia carnea TaxID=37328 RepID=A0ABW7TH28_9NOCA|nr:hypothetical protein [Nocardia carnea]